MINEKCIEMRATPHLSVFLPRVFENISHQHDSITHISFHVLAATRNMWAFLVGAGNGPEHEVPFPTGAYCALTIRGKRYLPPDFVRRSLALTVYKRACAHGTSLLLHLDSWKTRGSSISTTRAADTKHATIFKIAPHRQERAQYLRKDRNHWNRNRVWRNH
jgi:hypothetical protein